MVVLLLLYKLLARPTAEFRNFDNAGIAKKLAIIATLLVHALKLFVARLNPPPALEAEVDAALRTTISVGVH